VITELQKVKWPSREDVVQLTGVVIVTIVIVGLYVAALDGIFSRLFQAIGMYGAK
jgi:preprotein translocase SecE subunit